MPWYSNVQDLTQEDRLSSRIIWAATEDDSSVMVILCSHEMLQEYDGEVHLVIVQDRLLSPNVDD